MRRYHIQDRDDYKKYNKIVGMITKLTNVLRRAPRGPLALRRLLVVAPPPSTAPLSLVQEARRKGRDADSDYRPVA